MEPTTVTTPKAPPKAPSHKGEDPALVNELVQGLGCSISEATAVLAGTKNKRAALDECLRLRSLPR